MEFEEEVRLDTLYLEHWTVLLDLIILLKTPFMLLNPERRYKCMKVALVHDYLSQDGGAERVLKALHETLPFSSHFVYSTTNKQRRDIFVAGSALYFLQFMPWGVSHYRWF